MAKWQRKANSNSAFGWPWFRPGPDGATRDRRQQFAFCIHANPLAHRPVAAGGIGGRDAVQHLKPRVTNLFQHGNDFFDSVARFLEITLDEAALKERYKLRRVAASWPPASRSSETVQFTYHVHRALKVVVDGGVALRDVAVAEPSSARSSDSSAPSNRSAPIDPEARSGWQCGGRPSRIDSGHGTRGLGFGSETVGQEPASRFNPCPKDNWRHSSGRLPAPPFRPWLGGVFESSPADSGWKTKPTNRCSTQPIRPVSWTLLDRNKILPPELNSQS